MLTEPELRSQVRVALEAVSQPAPWLTAVIREELRKQRTSGLDRSRRARARLALTAGVIALVAAALAAVILIDQLSAPIQVHNPPPIQVHNPPIHQGGATATLGEVQFISPQDGLVVDKGGLLVTHDGGDHWQPTLKINSSDHVDARFVDPNHIVVLTGSQPVATLLHSTSDGGATWRTNSIASVPLTGQEDGIFFLNDHEGWREAASWPAPSPGPRLVVIYHTTDSGAHWTEIARVDQTHPASHGLLLSSIPEAANLVFTDSKHGVMPAFTIDNTVKLYITGDGGYNWQLVALPAPAGVTGSGPIMFGRDGVILLHSATRAPVFPYVTTDGGLTWTLRHAPADGPFSFLDGRHWWQISFADNTIYSTSDAGITWQPVSAALPTGFSIVTIMAVSDRVLWGLAATTTPGTPGEGCGPPSSIRCLIPIRSVDGGANWVTRPLPADA